MKTATLLYMPRSSNGKLIYNALPNKLEQKSRRYFNQHLILHLGMTELEDPMFRKVTDSLFPTFMLEGDHMGWFK